MTRPPTYQFWKFLMKNMIPTNSGLTIYMLTEVMSMLQGETDQIIANIRYVENETTTKLRKEELRKPFRIVVTKSDVYIHYPLVYLGVSFKIIADQF